MPSSKQVGNSKKGLRALAIIAAILLIVFLIAGLPSIGGYYEQWSVIDMERIVQFIRASGRWGVLASIGLMIIHSFLPFPAEVVAIANGMIYGPSWGFVITWTGAMLGAYLAFGLTRRLGRKFVIRLIKGDKLKQFDDWLAHEGASIWLFSRFVPIIAFNLINYAAGLSKVSWWTFSWTTGLGIMPMTALMVVAGDRLYHLPASVVVMLLGFGAVLSIGSHYLVKRVRSRRLDK